MTIVYHKCVFDDNAVYYHFMEVNGKCYSRAYTFQNDKGAIYLSDLSVSEGYRNNGLGLEMQLKREDLGRELGCKYSYLFVRKGSWMRKWYDRRGYKYFCKKEDDKTSVWLRKKL